MNRAAMPVKSLPSQWASLPIPHMAEWCELANEVRKFKPDFIVLLARKMTRFWQMLQEADRLSFLPDVQVVSHYALSYMDTISLKGKRIAIIDDAINVGSTMNYVYSKLNPEGKEIVKCFALWRKEGQSPSLVGETFILKEQQPLTDEEYRAKAALMNRTLLFTGSPLELEFPVYRLDLGDKSQDDFLGALKSQEADRCNWVTHVDADIAGYRRISIFRIDSCGDTVKLRFYFDKHKDTVLCAPMIMECKNAADGVFLGRASLYARADKIIAEYAPILLEYGVKSLHLAVEDARLLFGTPFTDKLITKDKQSQTKAFKIDSRFMQDALDSSSSFLHNMKNIEIANSQGVVFVKLFQELGKAVGEDNPLECDSEFASSLPPEVKDKLESDVFHRLSLGLSFPDIVSYLGKYWTKAKDLSKEKLQSIVSKLLDEHIDQGFVVPILDLAGRRAFRKGEALPQDRALLYALGAQGAAYGDNLEARLTSMNPAQRKNALYLLEAIEFEDCQS